MTKFKKGDKVWVEGVLQDYPHEKDVFAVRVKVKCDDWSDTVYVHKDQLLSVPTWTPVEDGLPEIDKSRNIPVKLTTEGGFVRRGYFSMDGHFTNKLLVQIHFVTAWMLDLYPAPYVPPVKLRERCEGCEYRDVFENKLGHRIKVCTKWKKTEALPHLINNKPCSED